MFAHSLRRVALKNGNSGISGLWVPVQRAAAGPGLFVLVWTVAVLGFPTLPVCSSPGVRPDPEPVSKAPVGFNVESARVNVKSNTVCH